MTRPSLTRRAQLGLRGPCSGRSDDANLTAPLPAGSSNWDEVISDQDA